MTAPVVIGKQLEQKIDQEAPEVRELEQQREHWYRDAHILAALRRFEEGLQQLIFARSCKGTYGRVE
jgi:hypothetical protein